MKRTRYFSFLITFCLFFVSTPALYAQTTVTTTTSTAPSPKPTIPISPTPPIDRPVLQYNSTLPTRTQIYHTPFLVNLIQPSLVTPNSITRTKQLTPTLLLATTSQQTVTIQLPTLITQTLSVTKTAALSGTQSISKTEGVTQSAKIIQTLPITKDTPFNWAASDNYLLLGSDQQASAKDWHTDSILIIGFERSNRRAAVFSIPRDLYVAIPGDVAAGEMRLSEVDAWAEHLRKESGPKMISQILSQTLGVSTPHWVRMRMSGLTRLVDALGGVTVPLDCPFSEPIINLATKRWEDFTLPAGNVLMDGQTANWFLRLRLRENDFGRAMRQRQFLWSLREKALNTNLVTRAPELWAAFQDTFTSNLTLKEFIELSTTSLYLQPEKVRASGFTMQDLEVVVTSEGTRLFRIGDAQQAQTKFQAVWQAPPLSLSYRHDASGCTNGSQVAAGTIFSATLAGITTTLSLSDTVTQPISDVVTSESVPTAEISLPSTINPVLSSRNANPELFVGQRIRIRKGFATDVRSQPTAESGRSLGAMGNGEQAVILGGPAQTTAATDIIVWWFVRTDSGIEGWAAANTESAGLFDVVR